MLALLHLVCLSIGVLVDFYGRHGPRVTSLTPSVQLCLVAFWARRFSVERNSYGDVAGWLAGWLGGCLSQPVLYQND